MARPPNSATCTGSQSQVTQQRVYGLAFEK